MNKKILVTNIQRFCVHDGPGIRTTIFLKGCTVHCPWCANPENISRIPQKYHLTDGRGQKQDGEYGIWMSPHDIYNQVIKDKVFYDMDNPDYFSRGGTTFSGGEPLMQADVLKPLMHMLKQEKISQSIETALFVGKKDIKLAYPYIDTWIIDIKILDQKLCGNIIGGDIELYLQNLEILFSKIRNEDVLYNKSVIFRIPFICGYTDTDKNLQSILSLLKSYTCNALRYVDIIGGHNLSKKKYESLGMQMVFLPNIDDEHTGITGRMRKLKEEIEKIGIRANICLI